MEPPGQRKNITSLGLLLNNKANVEDCKVKGTLGQIVIDSLCFEEYGALPGFDRIRDKSYIDSLFILRDYVGKDILVSDLKRLRELDKRGDIESYMTDKSRERCNSAVCDKNSGRMEYFMAQKNDIDKFYISSDRITFFAGINFYCRRNDGGLYEYSGLDREELTQGESFLEMVSVAEEGLVLKH